MSIRVRSADFVHDMKNGVSRIAFGSCNKQYKAQPMWSSIQNVDAWFWTGDVVYPNRSDAEGLEIALREQREHKEYIEFAQRVPILDGTWDDHDLGVNDAGKHAQELQRRLRAYIHFLRPYTSRQASRHREKLAEERGGAYCSHIFQTKETKEKKNVLFILLDTRSFRDDHLIPSVGAMFRNVPIIGRFMPLLASATRFLAGFFTDAFRFSGDVLGDDQWLWLENTLKNHSDAQFVILVTSIQFATSNPSFESWQHFPEAKRRFLHLLAKTKPKGLLLISGDVHHAELSAQSKIISKKHDDTSVDSFFPEVTSSGLTHTLATSKLTRLLFPPLLAFFRSHRLRPDDYSTQLNYGLIDFRWQEQPSMQVTVHGLDTTPLLRPLDIISRPYGNFSLLNDHRTCPEESSSLASS